MIVNEKNFQRILALNPELIANTMGINPNNSRVVSVEFVYGHGVDDVSSRFDIVLRVHEDSTKFKDIYLELKTLDSSSSYSQIEKYHNILKYDEFNSLADCPRELHFMVLENEYSYPKLKSYIDKFNSTHDEKINLYTVKEKDFVKYLELSGDEKYDVDYFTNDYKVDELQLGRISNFISGDINKAYLLNFINYLSPKYGAENSGKRYKNAAEFFYKVFGIVASNYNYDEIKIGENDILEPGNSRTINFKKDGRISLALFANTYPLQIKLYLKDEFDEGLKRLVEGVSKEMKLEYRDSKGNPSYWTEDNRLLIKAYPNKKKREVFIRLENNFEDEISKIEKIVDYI